jgi:hypothetical protein
VAKVQEGGGNSLPPSGKSVATGATHTADAARSSADPNDPSSLVAFLNKFLNDSGRPDQFRVDAASGGKFIQEINPASGAIVAEYAISEFPALARGLGASGLLVDGVA